jgi:thiamine-monophosphate kinase
LGYKAVALALNRIYAAGAKPEQVTVCTALSNRFSTEDVQELYWGISLAAEKYQLTVAANQLASSRTGLAISLTCSGQADENEIVTVGNAKPADLLCVSGNLGAAYMGLQLLEREKQAFSGQSDFQPDFAGREYILERQLKPEPKRNIIESLKAYNLKPTAMLSLETGLADGLKQICSLSKTGCRIYEERIPIDYQTAAMAEQINISTITAALNGGNDCELLLTLPLVHHEAIAQIPDLHLLGCLTPLAEGAQLQMQAGNVITLF